MLLHWETTLWQRHLLLFTDFLRDEFLELPTAKLHWLPPPPEVTEPAGCCFSTLLSRPRDLPPPNRDVNRFFNHNISLLLICNFFKTTTTTNPDSPLKTPPSGNSTLRLSIAWKTKNVVEISKQPSYCDPFQLTGLVCCFCWSPRLVTCFGSSQPRRRRTHGGRGRPLGTPIEQEEEEVHVWDSRQRDQLVGTIWSVSQCVFFFSLSPRFSLCCWWRCYLGRREKSTRGRRIEQIYLIWYLKIVSNVWNNLRDNFVNSLLFIHPISTNHLNGEFYTVGLACLNILNINLWKWPNNFFRQTISH